MNQFRLRKNREPCGRIRDAEVTIVADGLRQLNRNELIDQLALVVMQIPPTKDNQINNIITRCAIEEQVAKHFPNPLTRIGRSRNQADISKLRKHFQPRHRKGRRSPVN